MRSSQPTRDSSDILINGGGVIGICCAYYLALQKRRVTLVDKGEIGAGCSYRNAGLIVPSHNIPLAAPGVISKALKWLAKEGMNGSYTRNGLLMIFRSGQGLEEGIHEAALLKEYGIPSNAIDVAVCRDIGIGGHGLFH